VAAPAPALTRTGTDRAGNSEWQEF
jgi:hypothetical protein